MSFPDICVSRLGFMHFCVDFLAPPLPSPAYDISAVTCPGRLQESVWQHTGILILCGRLERERENRPVRPKSADREHGDEGRDETEERKELTGTSFQYQRVGHCQEEVRREGKVKEGQREHGEGGGQRHLGYR